MYCVLLQGELPHAGEVYTIAETLSEPCSIEMAEWLLDEQVKINHVKRQFSKTVHHYIQDLPVDREHMTKSHNGFSLEQTDYLTGSVSCVCLLLLSE